jgi:hypothetical protein
MNDPSPLQQEGKHCLLCLQRYGTKASRMVRIREDLTFAELLRHPGHVMPGVPVLFVLARDSPFASRFQQSFEA